MTAAMPPQGPPGPPDGDDPVTIGGATFSGMGSKVRAIPSWRENLGSMRILAETLGRLERSPSADEIRQMERYFARVRDHVVPPKGPGIVLVSAAELAAPLPPVPWLVEGLDLCPGAPALLAGYGFSGKTMAAQSLALSICSGLPAWGEFRVGTRGPVVHLDYEQGQRLTSYRYQKLARGMGLDLASLPISVAPLPRVMLDDPDAFEHLCRAFDGAVFGLVDSMRASAPSLDENSSEVRVVLDLLLRVSEKTGCTMLVIHHARKPSVGDTSAKASIRGSGAIFDACSSVLVLSGEKAAPKLMEHEKARTSGITAEDFYLTIESGRDAANLHWLKVTSTAKEAVEEKKTQARQKDHSQRVLRAILTHPGAGFRELKEYASIGDGPLKAGLRTLLDAGQIVERSAPHGGRAFWGVSHSPSEEHANAE